MNVLMRIVPLVLIVAGAVIIVASIPLGEVVEDDFCGFSTHGECSTDVDCFVSGCSGEVCQSIYEDEVVTPCIWKECYDAEAYGVSCGCVNGTCQWS